MSIRRTSHFRDPKLELQMEELRRAAASSELEEHANRNGGVHGLGPQDVFESVAGAQSKANAALAEARSYTDQEVAQALAEARNYTDQESAQGLAEARSYTDQAAAQALAQARGDTDQESAPALAEARRYTDREVAQALAEARSYTDRELAQLQQIVLYRLAGPTSNRPGGVAVGTVYFDTTLGK